MPIRRSFRKLKLTELLEIGSLWRFNHCRAYSFALL